MKPIEQWKLVLREGVSRRIPVDVFCKLAKILSGRAPVPQTILVEALLDSSSITAGVFSYDPLIPQYVTALRSLGLIRIPALLDGLQSRSFTTTHPAAVAAQEEEEEEGASVEQKPSTAIDQPRLMMSIRIVQDLIASFTSSALSLTAHDTRNIFAASATWILEMVALHPNDIHDGHQTEGFLDSSDALALFESLGILLVALSATTIGHNVLASDSTPGELINVVILSTYINGTSLTYIQNSRWFLDRLLRLTCHLQLPFRSICGIGSIICRRSINCTVNHCQKTLMFQ